MLLWSDLFAAMALYLVIEGLLAFVNPSALKRVLTRVIGMEDGVLRRSGLISIGLGLALLVFARS